MYAARAARRARTALASGPPLHARVDATDAAGGCKLERRADMLVSTLRRYVEAMGGRLDIVATFPDGVVRIANLGELAESGH